ncbi:MAG TPA: DUF3106 domain-containing protein [Candidatus Limnocylindria bacterium]|jgi:hypothetical protein|nr:DUF3106 domain-containing protein [Candidatus Limnocylindria bacterium]
MTLPWRSLLPLLLATGRLAVAEPATPPLPPPAKSLVEQFRALLSAPQAERERMLAGRTPEARAIITTKLREFEVLPPAEREIRLQVAQLQFYLSPLLHAAPEARADLLSRAPAEDRPLLEERLKAWDALDPETRGEILDSERSLSHFVRQESAVPKPLSDVLASVPALARPEVEAQFARWSALPPEERARKTANFQRFFGLSENERNRTLSRLPEDERRQMARALARFASLPPELRERCVRAFHKFAALSAEERAEFLRNAAKWQAMSADERKAWQNLVQHAIQPPLPPPPVPVPLRRPNSAVAVTNLPPNRLPN